MLTGRLLRVLRECENVGKKVLTLFCLSFIVFFSIFGGAIEAVFNSCSRFSSYISSPCIFMAITSEFHCITAFFFFSFFETVHLTKQAFHHAFQTLPPANRGCLGPFAIPRPHFRKKKQINKKKSQRNISFRFWKMSLKSQTSLFSDFFTTAVQTHEQIFS